MSAYLALSLPLYLAGQIALAFDLGARVFAVLGGRWSHARLALVFAFLPSLALWSPWLAWLIGLAPATSLAHWIWAHGALGGALFIFYAAAPVPGVKKRPPDVRNETVRVSAFPVNSAPGEPDGPVPLEIRRDCLKVSADRCFRENLSIGVISDLHVYTEEDVPFVEWCLDQLNAFSPDIVVALGDLTRVESMLGRTAAALEGVRSRLGVYACLGNHDLALGAGRGGDVYADRSVRIVTSQDGEQEILPGFTISATEWPFDGDSESPLARREDVPGLDAARFRLLLAHSPDNIGRAARAGYDLLLCGHTHGGFPYLPGFGPVIVPIRRGRGLACGWFRKGRTHMFVTRGVGYVMSSPSARRPQVACIDLVVP